MPAARIVQFDCPACGDLIELHNVNMEYIEVVIKDLAADLKQGRQLGPCALEALKFALIAHLDPGSEIMTIMEVSSASHYQALPAGDAHDEQQPQGEEPSGASGLASDAGGDLPEAG